MVESDAPNESTGIKVRKFNPGTLQSDRQVVDQFVVRRRELDIVLEIVRGNIRSASCQHVLVVGPRGRGKTMLLARAEVELRTDKEVSERLLPVRFMEESHEIATVADFWLETLFHLSRVIAAAHPGLAAELRATHASPERAVGVTRRSRTRPGHRGSRRGGPPRPEGSSSWSRTSRRSLQQGGRGLRLEAPRVSCRPNRRSCCSGSATGRFSGAR